MCSSVVCQIKKARTPRERERETEGQIGQPGSQTFIITIHLYFNSFLRYHESLLALHQVNIYIFSNSHPQELCIEIPKGEVCVYVCERDNSV